MKTITDHHAQTIQLFEPYPGTIHTIEQVGHIAGVPRRSVLVYCKHGLLSPLIDPEYGGYYFDDESIRTVRRIEYLHHTCGVNLEGIKMILDLVNEVERMRNELSFLRQ
jgi:DNA-binding transcriptional MerR regulator